LTYFAASSSPRPKSHSRVTDKSSIFSAPTDDPHRDFSSSDLRDVHGFRGGRFGLDAEQAREVFPEDQIQLIGIEARVFDDLADLETERPFHRTQSPTRLIAKYRLRPDPSSTSEHG
jgi:hypothetical protein